MFMKNYLAIAAISLLTTSVAIADYADNDYANLPSVSISSLFIEGNASYSFNNWNNDQHVKSEGISANGSENGFSYGFDVGYLFNSFLAIEAGWIHNPQTKLTKKMKSTCLKSWTGYLAARFSVPLFNNQSYRLFGTIGAAYSDLNAHDIDMKFNRVSPIYSAGIQFESENDIRLALRYTFIPGQHEKNKVVPDANLVSLGIGFRLGA